MSGSSSASTLFISVFFLDEMPKFIWLLHYLFVPDWAGDVLKRSPPMLFVGRECGECIHRDCRGRWDIGTILERDGHLHTLSA